MTSNKVKEHRGSESRRGVRGRSFIHCHAVAVGLVCIVIVNLRIMNRQKAFTNVHIFQELLVQCQSSVERSMCQCYDRYFSATSVSSTFCKTIVTFFKTNVHKRLHIIRVSKYISKILTLVPCLCDKAITQCNAYDTKIMPCVGCEGTVTKR
jgi:hypothetical protein